jgi:hypothetical protein
LSEIEGTAAALDTDDARLKAIGAALHQACTDLRAVLEWIIGVQGDDPRLPAAASGHYLKLWGIACGGWQLAKAAQICLQKAASGGDDSGFRAAKIDTAHFFAVQVMPQTTALAATIIDGSGSVVAFDAANF